MNSRLCSFRFLLRHCSCFCLILCFTLPLHSNEKVEAKSKRNHRLKRLTDMLEGIQVGSNSRVFPYASLEDWFDPYGGLKFKHPAFWNKTDRLVQHIKFETLQDYSWKFRYLAHSLSTEAVLVSFLFKLKFDRDAFFYGVGNSTIKSDRVEATYGSVFFGTELKTVLGESAVLRVSPGFWTFRSGLKAGGEFENPSDAQFVTSRLSLSTLGGVDYRSKRFAHEVSAYVELGFPFNDQPAFYSRLNFESLTRVPLFGNTLLSAGSRTEYLLSPERERVPYFALSEAGSRSGLRGYSKERFRNYALLLINFELVQWLSKQFEVFVLSDLAKTGSDPIGLLDNRLHPSWGVGLRFINKNSPIAAGIARGREGWKAFSTINASLSF